MRVDVVKKFGMVIAAASIVWTLMQMQGNVVTAAPTSRPTAVPTTVPGTSEPEVPSVLAAERQCTQNKDLIGGELRLASQAGGAPHGYYQPPSCNMKLLDDTDWKTCLATKQFAFFGDSQLEGMMNHLAGGRLKLTPFKQNLTSPITGDVGRGIQYPTSETQNISFFFNPMLAAYPEDRSIKTSFNLSASHRALEGADVIIINGGMWDMGSQCCGAERFYEAVKRYLSLIVAHKKASAEVVVFGLRYIHRKRCPKVTEQCYTCNHPDKVRAFREALLLAASCMGVTAIDTHMFSELLPNNTRDGVHYGGEVHNMELDLIGNVVCGPRMAGAQVPCDENAMFTKWRTFPEAYYGCANKTEQCKLDKPRKILENYDGKAQGW